MCGLAGFLSRRAPDDGALAIAMATALTHRGPDSSGVWCDSSAGFALAHRRLAILDASPAGAQPMRSASGNFIVALNGEIYNHLDLRRELEAGSSAGIFWRGHSDTETLLEGIAVWGFEETLRRCVGMFAIALWDRTRRELVLARDRMGEKPLYYGWQGDVFLFGSELKALVAHPAWRGDVDRDSLALFMRYGYVPLPHSIWRGVRKLLPGSFLKISSDAQAGLTPVPTAYWRARDVAIAGVRNDLDDLAAANELDARLRQSVALQMVADVPLGSFLSGGIDSSAIAALMQAQSPRPIRTFSIGFAESEYDEAIHAKNIAAHLGTDHTEFYLAPADALAVISQLPEMFDEPFGDSSQIPTHLVAVMARRHVTVSLSGDGGDEIFGGYNRYTWGHRVWRYAEPLPQALRSELSRLLTAFTPVAWDRIGRMLPRGMRQPTLGDRMHKLAEVIDVVDADEMYHRLISKHRDPAALVLGGREVPIWADEEAAAFAAHPRGADITERMMFQDLVGYMVDDILTKVDRASMACSLETRAPFLDHRLVEFAWTLPLHLKIRLGQGKWLLRQVLYRYVPSQLIERPKQGFGIPLDSWLRGPLCDWADALLDESRLRDEGFFNVHLVRLRWAEHRSGRRNWQHLLWNILMFQAWRERWL